MVHYIPILTTLFSVFFLYKIVPHYISKPKAYYLLWWMLGVLAFGLGTLTESIHAIIGWNEANVKAWYITGALLGGFPLAQGTTYLLLDKRKAHALTLLFVGLIVVASVFVILSPVLSPALVEYRLTGKVLEWKWVRTFSPFINLYSLVMLVGGAIYSAMLYARKGLNNKRFYGNVLIALGALLPGIGGSFTRFGYVEVLFVTELIGLLCIYFGYEMMKNGSSESIHANQTATV